MTIHSSLRGADSLGGERSVLKRVERILKLTKDGKFDEEADSVWGLPKVRTKFKVAGAKKKAKAEDDAAAPGTEGAEGAEVAASGGESS